MNTSTQETVATETPRTGFVAAVENKAKKVWNFIKSIFVIDNDAEKKITIKLKDDEYEYLPNRKKSEWTRL